MVWWWHKLLEKPIDGIAILLVLSALGAAIVAKAYSWVKPTDTLIIASFELSSPPPKAMPITGTTAANLLRDEVSHILRSAVSYNPPAFPGEESRKSSETARSTASPEMPVKLRRRTASEVFMGITPI
jgi:hypothetical protein